MFGNNLKGILDKKGMTFSDLQKQLSTYGVKVTNSQLSYYAKGQRHPKNKKIWLDIAQILGVKLQEIILDANYYAVIMDEISEKKIEKNYQTEKSLEQEKLFDELYALIDKNSASELEKVMRYCSLAENFQKLSQEITLNGVTIEVMVGENILKKPNPAIAEQVKVNAALIKLDEFFDKKRELKPKNRAEKDWSKFTK